MKLNWAEMLVVNNPLRVFEQRFQIGWMKKHARISSGGSFLEIGCGRGAGASIIREKFSPGFLCATDLDPKMMNRALRYLPGQKRKSISFCAADGLYLPFPDSVFDAVFGFGVLHHIPDWQGALAEIARVLKPGGTYFLEELYPTLYQNFITRHILLHPEENRFCSPELKEALDSAFFTARASFELKFAGILAVLEKVS
ncbi:MAG: class I SAM-dependent methyltransferase [Syntrophobacteraceae bacterium]|nr:class I SAM-dependent methyltransferase [Syntrophobacteraceae bacterium]